MGTNNPCRKIEKNHGFDKPQFAGRVFGQVYGTDGYVATGKRYPIKRPDGSTFWMAIVESRFFSHWVWDGTEWLTNEDFRTLYEIVQPVSPEVRARFPSKNDFDGLGMPKPKWLR